MSSTHTKLSKSDILHLAKLANLSISETEISKYESQLAETIDYVENMKELDTKGVAVTSQTTDLTNVFFEDGSANTRALTPEEAVANSKTKQNGYFKVKKIM